MAIGLLIIEAVLMFGYRVIGRILLIPELFGCPVTGIIQAGDMFG